MASNQTPVTVQAKRNASSPLERENESHPGKKGRGESGLFESGSGSGVEPVHYVSGPMHPDDIVRIANELKSLMLPELNLIVQKTQPDIKSIINEAVASAVSSVKAQYESDISALKASNDLLFTERTELDNQVQHLTKELTLTQRNLEEVEQYTRRSCLRISGVAESPSENIDKVVLGLGAKLGAGTELQHIDRAHRIGNKSPKDIIVKFSSYRYRRALFSKRLILKSGKSPGDKRIFINELLTPTRGKLLFDARTLVKQKRLKSAYTLDGNVFVVDTDDVRHAVKSPSDLLSFSTASIADEDTDSG